MESICRAAAGASHGRRRLTPARLDSAQAGPVPARPLCRPADWRPHLKPDSHSWPREEQAARGMTARAASGAWFDCAGGVRRRGLRRLRRGQPHALRGAIRWGGPLSGALSCTRHVRPGRRCSLLARDGPGKIMAWLGRAGPPVGHAGPVKPAKTPGRCQACQAGQAGEIRGSAIGDSDSAHASRPFRPAGWQPP